MSGSIMEFFEANVFGEKESEAFPLLTAINSPGDVKALPQDKLGQLSKEVRHFIIQTLTRTGGHLGSNLGTVELAVALHYVFDFLKDRIVWDVGHQAYPHKVLTGRRKGFDKLRQYGGISGFLKIQESPFDHFGAGHASTSISAALGMAVARDQKEEQHQVLAVIGDGAMTGGMAFEALNQLGYLQRKMIVILNDNEMSISPNVGALSGYLNQIISGQFYARMRERVEKSVKAIPGIGDSIAKKAHQLEHLIKTMLVPGSLFQELGFHYVGPVNGHDAGQMVKVFDQYKDHDGPVLIHVRTVKGKGFGLAEELSETYHGVKIGYLRKQESPIEPLQKKVEKKAPSYTKVFAQTLSKMADLDERIVGITAAMPSGTGLADFGKRFPERYFDVGIAEQHAVTFAAGLATRNLKPVAAIYSTFLQRAIDQVIHDVCLQDLDVTFCMDRAGLVGADGPTHHGVFDISYLRMIPKMVAMAASDENELQHMIYTAVNHPGPAAVRYPRGSGLGIPMDEELKAIPIGKGEVRREGDDLLMVGYGPMVHYMLEAAAELEEQFGIKACVINARFVKPLDLDLIIECLPANKTVITLEDGNIMGGFGSAVLEGLMKRGHRQVNLKMMGIDDCFVTHGDIPRLHADHQMNADSVINAAVELLELKEAVSASS